jgi:hypothetical protein
MGGFDRFFKKQWERGKKIDPLTHKAMEAVMKMDSKVVRESAKGVDKLFGGDGDNFLSREADKNVNDPARGIGRAAASVGLVYGGMALAGGGAGAGAGAGAAAEGGAAAGFGGSSAGAIMGGGEAAAAGGGAAAAGGGAGGAAFIPGADSAAWGASQGYGATTAGTPSSVNLVNAGGTQQVGGGGFSWQKMGDMMSDTGNSMQQPGPPRIEESDVRIDTPDLGAVYGLSSKQAKQAPGDSANAAMARGAAGGDPIDQNGVQMAAIQALTARVQALRAKVQQHKGVR